MQIPEDVEVKKVEWTHPITRDVFSDPIEIEYYKSILQEEMCENLLIGSFNDNGSYSIEKDILIELIAMNKYIVDVVEGNYDLIAKIKSEKSFELKFILSISYDEEYKKKVAVLKLVEKYTSLDSLTELPIKTTIARYKDDDDIYFLQKVAKAFHIIDKRNSDGREEDQNEEAILKIKALLLKLKAYKTKFTETNEHLSSYYIDNVLASLKSHPCKFSDFILRKYALIMEANKALFGKPNFYRTIRLELDKLLMQNIKLCDNEMLARKLVGHKAEFLTAKKGFDESLLSAPAKKAEKKAEVKKPTPSASPSKSVSKAKPKAKPKVKAAEAAAPQPQFIDYSKMKRETLYFETKPIKKEPIKVQKREQEQINKPIDNSFMKDILDYSNNLINIIEKTAAAKKLIENINVDLSHSL